MDDVTDPAAVRIRAFLGKREFCVLALIAARVKFSLITMKIFLFTMKYSVHSS